MKTLENKTPKQSLSNLFPPKVIRGWFVAFLALGLSSWAIDFMNESLEMLGYTPHFIKALIMCGIIIIGVWWMRSKDQNKPSTIGLSRPSQAIKYFLIGLSFIIFPVLLSLVMSSLFGWSEFRLNLSSEITTPLLYQLLLVFIYEALPEELIFRGYIYSNLNANLPKWKSGLITVILFALLPALLYPVQKYLIQMDLYINGAETLTFGYILTMMIFGSFVQYLRIISGSIWLGIGFHLAFVYFNRLIGLDSNHLIQFYNVNAEQPMQLSLLAGLILVLIGLIAYPYWSGNKIGWKALSI